MLIMTKTPTIRQQSAALIPDYEAAVVSSSFRKGLECEGLTRENKEEGWGRRELGFIRHRG